MIRFSVIDKSLGRQLLHGHFGWGKHDPSNPTGAHVEKAEFNVSVDNNGNELVGEGVSGLRLSEEFRGHCNNASYEHRITLKHDDPAKPTTASEYLEYLGTRIANELGLDKSNLGFIVSAGPPPVQNRVYILDVSLEENKRIQEVSTTAPPIWVQDLRL